MNGIPSVVVPIGCVAFRGVLACDAAFRVPGGCNVRGEPVFSVMAAGWFCEKSG
jgi:hypothetical protein